MQHVFGSKIKARKKTAVLKQSFLLEKCNLTYVVPEKRRKLAIAPEVLRNERRLRKLFDVRLV
jgi:hypothetical protein